MKRQIPNDIYQKILRLSKKTKFPFQDVILMAITNANPPKNSRPKLCRRKFNTIECDVPAFAERLITEHAIKNGVSFDDDLRWIINLTYSFHDMRGSATKPHKNIFESETKNR